MILFSFGFLSGFVGTFLFFLAWYWRWLVNSRKVEAAWAQQIAELIEKGGARAVVLGSVKSEAKA